MKNRAGLLALVVLAIAILLMVFVVMPQMQGQKTGNDVAKTPAQSDTAASSSASGEAAKTSRPQSTEPPGTTTKAEDVGQALGNLMRNASGSLDELNKLFIDGKGPPEDAFQTAKSNAIGALDALAGYTPPANADTASTDAVTKAKDGANKALAIIKSLPENITDARAAIASAIAALRGAAPPSADKASASPSPTGSDAAPSAPSTSEAAKTAKTEQGVPSFDVLRVEPDGSAVVAGSAAPNSKLDVMNGNQVVATTKTGPSGDFAAVLDQPLPPGDHQLVLRATTADGKTSTSEEVATVSVPRDKKQAELLAMVSKPGQASRIITAPEQNEQAASGAASAGKTEANQNSTAPAANQQAAAGTMASKSGMSDAQADVTVTAVEIEGSRIFVAGRAKPGSKLQAYADDKLIGNSTTGADGNFVIDGTMDLAVGDHKIRVDLLGPDGKVAVRTSVNFNRPDRDQVTVAAQSNSGGEQQAASLEEGTFEKLKSDAAKAYGLLSALFANNQVPTSEQLAAARSATEIALRSIVDFRASAEATEAFRQAVNQSRKLATDALGQLRNLPDDPSAVKEALPKLAALIDQLAPKPQADSADNTSPSIADGPRTIEQAPLTESNGTVIIRRGDTLWQISRRVYGAGVRYTTIYIANEDKIRNPDRILPGQIFGLPKDALPNSEELHRKRLNGGHM